MGTTNIPLSQFCFGYNIRLTVKRSKNQMKRICIGADRYEAKSFSIVMNPYRDVGSYRLRISRTGGLQLLQDPEGSIGLTVNPDATLDGTITPPDGDYLEVTRFKTRNYQDGRVTEYIPLLKINTERGRSNEHESII